jgi:hypothetical protein
VTLADRTSSALVDHISVLRAAFRVARQECPFTIEAIVILPDHLHAIWTLPSGDADFSGRWKRIKAYFTHWAGDLSEAMTDFGELTLSRNGPSKPAPTNRSTRGAPSLPKLPSTARSDPSAHAGYSSLRSPPPSVVNKSTPPRLRIACRRASARR